MPPGLRALLLAVGLVGHVFLQAVPAWKSISKASSGRDFASYYYAAEVAREGGNPYDTDALELAARAQKTRKQVHPFFYPPPFVGVVAWAPSWSLHDAYKISFILNELALAGCLAVGVAWFSVPLWAVAALLCTWSPIPDNAWMGQANLWALLPALVGLGLVERSREVGHQSSTTTRNQVAGGILVGLAAMLKMSPALFLLYWLIRRQWVPIAAACGTAIASSIAVLPLVDFAAQREFYLAILPGFSAGDYHGLSVPISLPANHSIADLYDRAFPNAGRLLSDEARRATAASAAALLAIWGWFAYRYGREPMPVATNLGLPNASEGETGGHSPTTRRSRVILLAALTFLMVVIPVYTYEHHLVFLVVAVGVAAGGVQAVAYDDWRAGRRTQATLWWLWLIAAWFFIAWPLPWLRGVQGEFPSSWGWLFRESKTMAEGAFFVLLLCLSGKLAKSQPVPPTAARQGSP